MLLKSRTNSPARRRYENYSAVLRCWQHYTRNPQERGARRMHIFHDAWIGSEKMHPELCGHLTEVYFWADHEAGVHAPAKTYNDDYLDHITRRVHEILIVGRETLTKGRKTAIIEAKS